MQAVHTANNAQQGEPLSQCRPVCTGIHTPLKISFSPCRECWADDPQQRPSGDQVVRRLIRLQKQAPASPAMRAGADLFPEGKGGSGKGDALYRRPTL